MQKLYDERDFQRAVQAYRYLEWDTTENDALEDLNMSGVMAGVKYWF